jgi:hypothetical protein
MSLSRCIFTACFAGGVTLMQQWDGRVVVGVLRHCVVEVWRGSIEGEGERCADVGEEGI